MTSATARLFVLVLAASSLALLVPTASLGQDGYRQPPDNIVKILKAEPLPSVAINPTRTHMLLLRRQAMPSIAEMAQPMLRLAGSRINPKTNGPHSPGGIIGLTVKAVATGKETPIELPEGVQVQGARWSADGKRFAFAVTHEDGSELWLGEADTGEARKLTGRNLNTLNSGGFDWMPDGEQLLLYLIPEDRGEPPAPVEVPTGPVIQESSGRTSPVRTYQDLLENPRDEALFDYYFTSRPFLLDLETGEQKPLAMPAVYSGISASPTGRYLMVSRTERPYSYMVTRNSFPEILEVLDLETMESVELAKLPLRDQTPIAGVPTGPRGHQWQDTAGVDRILWVEALDEGNPRNKNVPHRDRIMALDAPFSGEPTELWRTEHRFAGMDWLEGQSRALVSEFDRDRRWSRTWLVELGRPVTMPEIAEASRLQPAGQQQPNKPILVWDRSSQDRYGDPGRPVTTLNEAGRNVVDVETLGTEQWIYLSGSGASPTGDRPFLDRLNLASLQAERLWQNQGEAYESFVAILAQPAGTEGEAAAQDGRPLSILTRYETPAEPPNYFILSLAPQGEGDDFRRTQVTDFEHPAPQLRDVKKELVTYRRDDGVTLSATLYLPPGYQEGQRLPLLVWAYPREFNDPELASQVSGSPYRFTSIDGTSHLFLLLEGYAIMESRIRPEVRCTCSFRTRSAYCHYRSRSARASSSCLRFAERRRPASCSRPRGDSD